MTTTFAQLGLPKSLVRALEARGIVEPFPVQEATIPDALAGKDVSGKAPTVGAVRQRARQRSSTRLAPWRKP